MSSGKYDDKFKILEGKRPVSIPDESDKNEDSGYGRDKPVIKEIQKEAENRKKQIENNILNEDYESKKQDRELRKEFANKIFWGNVIWMFFVAIMIMQTGMASYQEKGFLSNQVIIALIGGGTTSIIGLLFAVCNYLFPNKGKDDKKNS